MVFKPLCSLETLHIDRETCYTDESMASDEFTKIVEKENDLKHKQ